MEKEAVYFFCSGTWVRNSRLLSLGHCDPVTRNPSQTGAAIIVLAEDGDREEATEQGNAHQLDLSHQWGGVEGKNVEEVISGQRPKTERSAVNSKWHTVD